MIARAQPLDYHKTSRGAAISNPASAARYIWNALAPRAHAPTTLVLPALMPTPVWIEVAVAGDGSASAGVGSNVGTYVAVAGDDSASTLERKVPTSVPVPPVASAPALAAPTPTPALAPAGLMPAGTFAGTEDAPFRFENAMFSATAALSLAGSFSHLGEHRHATDLIEAGIRIGGQG